MDLRITPAPLRGTVTPPPSKSQTHRAILAASLAEGRTVIRNAAASRDIEATLSCVRGFGCFWNRNGYALELAGTGGEKLTPGELMYCGCGESGSTLRFLLPLSLTLAGGGYFVGGGRLMERPLGPYFDIFREKGVCYEREGGALTVRGHLAPGEYCLPGDVSSQFVTGLLFALPLLEGDSRIILTTPLESRGYVEMTLDMLGRFGVRAEVRPDGFAVPGGQRYAPCGLTVEADWSQGAFWLAAGQLGNEVEAAGLDPDSLQGDRAAADDLAALARPGEVELDLSQCPDLLPPLAAAAALRTGEVTRFTRAARMRLKESDRLSAVARVLGALGADAAEGPDFLRIRGVPALTGGAADCENDHRIAMMAAIAATRSAGPVTLLGAECVEKSYPGFWEDYRMLGGKLDVL